MINEVVLFFLGVLRITVRKGWGVGGWHLFAHAV